MHLRGLQLQRKHLEGINLFKSGIILCPSDRQSSQLPSGVPVNTVCDHWKFNHYSSQIEKFRNSISTFQWKHCITETIQLVCWSEWQRGLRLGSVTACLLGLWVRIPLGAWMSVCCECCVLSGIGLCDEPISCPEYSYRLWCVVMCDLETSRMRRPWPA